MPIDETLPIYHFSPDRENALRTTISFSTRSSVPEPKYTKQHIPNTPNTYSFVLHDSVFSAQVFADVHASLEPVAGDHTKRAGEVGTGTRYKIPKQIRIKLRNPDQAVALVYHAASGPFTSSFWEFSLPKEAFYQPTGSMLDAANPPSSEKCIFRWRKEGKLSPTLKCTYTPNATPGVNKRGYDEPDTTIATYTSWESTAGRLQGKGQLVIFEGNQRRIDLQDWKGLEIALIVSAKAIVDVWYTKDAKETFQVGNVLSTATSPPEATLQRQIAVCPIPNSSQQQRQTHHQIHLQGQRIRQQPQLQECQIQQSLQTNDSHGRQTAQSLAKQEAAARKLQLQFEAEERARQKAIEKETKRLVQEFEKEKAEVDRMQRLQLERYATQQRHGYPSATSPRPAALAQWTALPLPNTQGMRKKSFFGLKLGGGSSTSSDGSTVGGLLAPRSSSRKKLEKRKSLLW